MIRPERVHLQVDEPPATLAGAVAEVVDLVFQGPVVRFGLRTADGSALVAHVGPEDEPSRCSARGIGLDVLGAGGRAPAARRSAWW